MLWERYRSFAEVAVNERVVANPLFTPLEQPRIGTYLAPGLPVSIGGHVSARRPRARARDDTTAVLAEHLGLGADQIVALTESGTVATGTDKR